ncbi:MAG TPA: FHA domain-containing protein, partial [bacterium]|nr:FHA domain-containing protein [bacterium]
MFELLLQRNSKPLICRKIGEEGLTIGRSAENSIVLLDPEISRRHCAIELKGESLRMRDLSKNGTLVNGQMAAEAPLSPGDTLTVGPWTLSVSGSKASASENTLACAPSVTRLVSCDEKKLVVTTEEIEFTVHAADTKPLRRNSSAEEITIGSLASCDIQVEDPFVSRRHCQVTRYGGSTTLVDLGSTNGTFVEGRRICAAALGSFGCFFAGRTRIDYKIA